MFDRMNYCCIAKDSVKSIPLISSIAKLLGTIFIDRSNKNSQIEVI